MDALVRAFTSNNDGVVVAVDEGVVVDDGDGGAEGGDGNANDDGSDACDASEGDPGGVLSDLSGVHLEGYEIHMGVSALKEGARPMTRIEDFVAKSGMKDDGAQKGNVYGTYVHGVFDKEEVAKAVITSIAREKGIDASDITGVDFQAFKETQYDILAAGLREHFDMEKIYQILNEGMPE